MAVKSDIEIAREAKMKPISEVATKVDIPGNALLNYGPYKAKISALESIDFFVLSKVRDYLDSDKDVRIVVTPSHAVPWKMQKYTRDYVPFVVAGKNIMADDYEKFSETASKASALKISKGPDFVKFILAK